jgi:hypothetical protein
VSKAKDVRAAVERELGFDPVTDSARITVRNIGAAWMANGASTCATNSTSPVDRHPATSGRWGRRASSGVRSSAR